MTIKHESALNLLRHKNSIEYYGIDKVYRDRESILLVSLLQFFFFFFVFLARWFFFFHCGNETTLMYDFDWINKFLDVANVRILNLLLRFRIICTNLIHWVCDLYICLCNIWYRFARVVRGERNMKKKTVQLPYHPKSIQTEKRAKRMYVYMNVYFIIR